jgi:uncharacterized membrane protein
MDLGIGWIGYFVVALLMAGLHFVFIKKGLEGMSAAMAVAIEAAVLLLIRLTVLDFKGLLSSMSSLSGAVWGRLLIFTVMMVVAWIAFYYSMQITYETAVAPFSMLVFPVVTITTAVIGRSLPSWQMIIILLLLIVGIFLMGFGREHKNKLWWIGAIGGALLYAAYEVISGIYPIKMSESILIAAQLLLIVIIAAIASVFMKHGDLKKLTVYHLLFIVLGALCLYFAPICYELALKGTSVDLLVKICFALWIFLNILGARIILKDKINNVCVAGLAMITIATIWRFFVK